MIEKALARYEAKPTARGFQSFISREEEPGQEFKAGRTGRRGGGGGGGGGKAAKPQTEAQRRRTEALLAVLDKQMENA